MCKGIFVVYGEPVPEQPTVVIPDTTQLKALTHPLRLRLLGLLRIHGPATATALAEQVGESTGSTSYHLRQLERHGFVADAAELGTRRERWWRASAQCTSAASSSSGPAERDAKGAWRQVVVSQLASRLQLSVEEQDALPEEWLWTIGSSDAVVHATLEQAHEIRRRLEAIIWEVLEQHPTPPDAAPEGTRPFEIQVHSYPRPERS